MYKLMFTQSNTHTTHIFEKLFAPEWLYLLAALNIILCHKFS